MVARRELRKQQLLLLPLPGPASGPDYYSADHDPADHYSYSHNSGPDHSARSTGHQASRGAGHSGTAEAEAETGRASRQAEEDADARGCAGGSATARRGCHGSGRAEPRYP